MITEADGVDTHVEGGGGSRKEDAREKEDSTRRKALICCFDCCIMSICPADRVWQVCWMLLLFWKQSLHTLNWPIFLDCILSKRCWVLLVSSWRLRSMTEKKYWSIWTSNQLFYRPMIINIQPPSWCINHFPFDQIVIDSWIDGLVNPQEDWATSISSIGTTGIES